MTREEKINRLNKIVKDSKVIDKNIIIEKLADSKYYIQNFNKVTITRIKGSALSTATGKELHNAIFDNRGSEALLTVKTNNGTINISLAI